ncbi:MAG: YggT family protein [Chloroflexota bacterium]|nr:YggT family protein [Chloroflexota bacterium]
MSVEHKEHVEVVRDSGYERRRQINEVAPSTQTTLVSRIIQLIWLLTAIVVLLIGVRFVLQMIGANEANAFASLIFQLTNPLISPFANLLPNTPISTGMAVEWSTLVAGVAYLLLGLLLTSLVRILFGSTRSVRRTRTVERSRS